MRRYLRGIAPDIPITTIYRGVMPFAGLQMFALVLLIMFPGIANWLPAYPGR